MRAATAPSGWLETFLNSWRYKKALGLARDSDPSRPRWRMLLPWPLLTRGLLPSIPVTDSCRVMWVSAGKEMQPLGPAGGHRGRGTCWRHPTPLWQGERLEQTFSCPVGFQSLRAGLLLWPRAAGFGVSKRGRPVAPGLPKAALFQPAPGSKHPSGCQTTKPQAQLTWECHQTTLKLNQTKPTLALASPWPAPRGCQPPALLSLWGTQQPPAAFPTAGIRDWD